MTDRMMGECRECRWWDRQHQIVGLMLHDIAAIAGDSDAGVCMLAEDDHEGVQFTAIGAYYDERGAEEGHLLTTGTFGCNQFASKEP